MNFAALGTVEAKGNSAVAVNYSFLDKQPHGGINYYRLKQLDRDGQFVISPVVKVSFLAGTVVALSPNPAHGYLNISMADQHATVKMMMVDMAGKVVFQEQLGQGSTSYRISLSAVTPGLYMIKLVGTAVAMTQKLVIQ